MVPSIKYMKETYGRNEDIMRLLRYIMGKYDIKKECTCHRCRERVLHEPENAIR